MEPPLSTLQFQALDISVLGLQTDPVNPLTKTVQYRLSYMGETCTLQATITPKKSKDKFWYVTRAIRKLRREIRAWVHSQDTSFTGQLSLQIEEINDDLPLEE